MLALSLVVAGAPSAATRRPITGVLSKPGYTLIALTADGRASSVRVTRGRFRFVPPGTPVTLHLAAPDGVYAGPVVIGRIGKTRAILGVRAGAALGRVVVRRGHATVARRLKKKWLDTRRVARARNGVPIGVAVFGRVLSRPLRLPVPGDADADGIPNPLDIDDDGDLVLDKLDAPGIRAAQTDSRAAAAGDRFTFHTNLTLDLYDSANANAAGLTVAQTDAALASRGMLMFDLPASGAAELDCGGSPDPQDPNGWIGGLSYCTRGGTGRWFDHPGPPPYPDFPECCDADGDGYGSLFPTPDPNPGVDSRAMFLRHGATSSQIGTGDVLVQRVTSNGVETQLPATVPYVFATVSALVSYDDGRGNSVVVPYPIRGPDPGPPGPGTRGNPFPVTAGPEGDVVVTLRFWRPQRASIPPEAGSWIDIGRLNYTAAIADLGRACPQSAFSEDDPNLSSPLTPIFAGNNAGGFTDLAADAPADPANTLTYTLNLTGCLAAHGFSFGVGERRGFSFAAVIPTGPDITEQYVFFKRQ